MIPALREKVVNPRLKTQNGTLPLNWTYNNCEAMNHILKMETNWKAEKGPELVESIHRIVQYSCSLPMYDARYMVREIIN